MGFFRLGFLTTYMSDSLISGFTTGSACHVFMSQVNKVLGVKLPRHEGFGMLIKVGYSFSRSDKMLLMKTNGRSNVLCR
jgi:MFS superfamily sulfate permease-like transporter